MMKSKNFFFMYVFFFTLPFAYLGNEKMFLYVRALLIIYAIFPVLLYRSLRFIISDLFLALLLAVMAYYCYSHGKLYPFPTIFLVYESYMLFSSKRIPFWAKKTSMNMVKCGCFVFGVLGLLYMLSSGNVARGGEYVVNSWGISNLTVSLFFSFYIVADSVSAIKSKGEKFRLKISFRLLLWCLSFLFIFFLGKRGPILFSLVSIVTACFIYNRHLKRILLVGLFLYPLWELPVTIFVTDYLVDRLENVYDRMNDFQTVDDNPRIVRLQAASVFITNFEPHDLIGYHTELILTDSVADTEHNHFHNFFLQLYYERGLLCILAVLIMLSIYREKKESRSPLQQSAFGLMLLLLTIGMNESLLLCGTAQEFLFYITYLYHKQVYDYEKSL